MTRDDRIRQFVRDKLTAQEAADREGISGVSDLSKKMKRFADELGVTRKGLVPYKKAYGLTADTQQMRHRLGNQLDLLVQKRGRKEAARLTGLSSVQMNKAIYGEIAGQPVSHNWTVAQIERLAGAMKIGLSDLLKYATEPYRVGQEWPPIQTEFKL